MKNVTFNKIFCLKKLLNINNYKAELNKKVYRKKL
jgi:hypothetical protein